MIKNNDSDNENAQIAIWGCGYIGLTTAISYALKRIRCYAYDIDKAKIEDLQEGKNPIINLDYWYGLDLKKVYQSGYIVFTSQKQILSNCTIHFIAVPTEKSMEPCYEAVMQVISDIADIFDENKNKMYVIFESTLTPGTLKNIIIPFFSNRKIRSGKDIILAIAPRRDWFISQDKNLKSLPRVIATYNNQGLETVKKILTIICDNVITSCDLDAVEMVKSVENTFRYMEISLANQLLLAYPNVNMDEVLRLCATKWNMGTYFCSFGIGGYCIPLAAKYLLQGSKNNNMLSIVKEAVNFNFNYLENLISNYRIERFKHIGIFGLSYKENIKVSKGSPTIELSRLLRNYGKEVEIHDPYYSSEEIMEITECKKINLDSENKYFDCIILMVAHDEYKLMDIYKFATKNSTQIIIDQSGIWNDCRWKSAKIKYVKVGELLREVENDKTN